MFKLKIHKSQLETHEVQDEIAFKIHTRHRMDGAVATAWNVGISETELLSLAELARSNAIAVTPGLDEVFGEERVDPNHERAPQEHHDGGFAAVGPMFVVDTRAALRRKEGEGI